jgi:hypothetical protein
MSFALNAAPFESNISFSGSINNKIKSTSELGKRIKKKKMKPVQMVNVDAIDEDDSLENFEPINRPQITKDTNRDQTNEENIENEISLEDNEISNFTSNPYLISNDIHNSNKEVNRISNENENNINDVERKLNYLIKMMETQKNDNVQYLTEEIILYGFFGVFIIYVIDSFTRVGKYVR